MTQPILQFGTGRFLQAHVDLFVSQALARGEALGGITVVQTTGSAQSSARLAAMARGGGYRVEVKGRRDGAVVDEVVQVDSIREAWQAQRDWPQVIAAASAAKVIVSNTADRGYLLDDADSAALLDDDRAVPRSFPAKLAVLLHHRWRAEPDAPLTLYPCELISRNGHTLRDLVIGLAQSWETPVLFRNYLLNSCVWVNSLVDRIVSTPLEPVGAIAEPYALWAIQKTDRMTLPCTHPDIVVTDDLAKYERLKLLLLNLGHSVLADRWIANRHGPVQTVHDAMNSVEWRTELESIWLEEVVPVFEADGEGDAARAYLVDLRDRLLNPFLQHRLSDIANDHPHKMQRRFAPVIERAELLNLGLPQTRLRAALGTRDSQRI